MKLSSLFAQFALVGCFISASAIAEVVQLSRDHEFDAQLLQSDKPLLVAFCAPYIGKCKTLRPDFETVASQYEGRATVVYMIVNERGTTTAEETVKKYNIRGFPTTMLFKNGKVVVNLIDSDLTSLTRALDKNL
ncbi:thioredoxin domain-containing protein [Pseudomonas proteolytica]|uniref:thioredoxin family protein n=1 Tax=Pseudomonas proteolytica TaxID=219574 RepID=UPI0023DF6610|nr:thioredoxin domain-containing protein [Pseudomonas proteolytica]MDF3164529.1 thioredoxin domain-containing protein [Pseudomonas proteolytica]